MSKIIQQSMVLETLFNSKMRVKVLKFLFRNNPVRFGVIGLSKMLQEPPVSITKEIKVLEKMGLIKKN